MPHPRDIQEPMSPLAIAAAQFGQGFSEGLQKRREQERAQDDLQRIFGSVPQTNVLQQMGIISPGARSTPGEITPAQMTQLYLTNPKLAKAAEPRYKEQHQQKQLYQKADIARSQEYMKKVDKVREGIPRKEMALDTIRTAVSNRSKPEFFSDVLAQITGNDTLRSKSGAQLASATKEFFLSDLSSLPGVRPNQFLEKALASAFTNPALKDSANELLLVGMQANVDLDKARMDIINKLEEQYGRITPELFREVDKMLAPVAQQLMDRAALETRDIIEKHDTKLQNFVSNYDNPKKRKAAAAKIDLKKYPGNGMELSETLGRVLLEKYGNDPAKAEAAARKLGYTIPE